MRSLKLLATRIKWCREINNDFLSPKLQPFSIVSRVSWSILNQGSLSLSHSLFMYCKISPKLNKNQHYYNYCLSFRIFDFGKWQKKNRKMTKKTGKWQKRQEDDKKTGNWQKRLETDKKTEKWQKKQENNKMKIVIFLHPENYFICTKYNLMK